MFTKIEKGCCVWIPREIQRRWLVETELKLTPAALRSSSVYIHSLECTVYRTCTRACGLLRFIECVRIMTVPYSSSDFSVNSKQTSISFI